MIHYSPLLISVIIPFLNEEDFLTEAIESVRQQVYPHWQLLLVDDGSTDQSTAIAKHYAANSGGQIIYCEHANHANKGLSASRNYGIRQCSGSLIALLDADDVWQPGKLAQQVAIFQEHPAIALVAEASRYWYSWQQPHAADTLITIGAPANRVYQPPELMGWLYPLGPGAAPCPSGLLFKKQAWQAVGGFEESFKGIYQLYEDQSFLSKIYLTQPIYISGACHNWYRQRRGSITQSVKAKGHYHNARRFFLEWLAAYSLTQSLSTPHLQQLLAKALRPYHAPFWHRVQTFFSIQSVRGLATRIITWSRFKRKRNWG
jgi:glycosyltransferase involved in cell wall biosynthesis